MKIIDFNTIESLNILPNECMAWVKEIFKIKENATLPPKISIKMEDDIFFNTMPCYIPSIERIGIKLVSRYPNRIPSLKSDLLLYDSKNGDSLALINADWITAMRTGAVAALSIKTFKSSTASIYSFVGLGNTGRATLLCLLNSNPEQHFSVRLLRYKDHAEHFVKRFTTFENVSFEIVNTNEELVSGADVIVSCVTALDTIFAKDEFYKEGVLVVPVHTRGFQNCDLFFDKIVGDDRDHIKDFKYFNEFKEFIEISDVLNGKVRGRVNDRERILAYNIGIALHDVYFANKIYHGSLEKSLDEVSLCGSRALNKFWL